jgi:hypothetical protein
MTIESGVAVNDGELDRVLTDTENSHSLGGLFAQCVAYLDITENASVPSETASRFFGFDTRD